MEGRGKYWFYSTTAPVTLFVGEVSDNTFQGLGKLVFRDGSQYYGSFVNNQMNSKKGVIYFNNGDKFKGQIERGQRNGPGELTSADSKYSFQGNFRDDLRDGSSCVFTIQTD